MKHDLDQIRKILGPIKRPSKIKNHLDVDRALLCYRLNNEGYTIKQISKATGLNHSRVGTDIVKVQFAIEMANKLKWDKKKWQ